MSMSAILSTDDRTRVPLSKLGATPKSVYQAEARDDGTIVLTPLAMIPAREMVVWENESLKEAILLGLAQASGGLAHANPDLDADLAWSEMG
jgi:hypothetical protein